MCIDMSRKTHSVFRMLSLHMDVTPLCVSLFSDSELIVMTSLDMPVARLRKDRQYCE